MRTSREIAEMMRLKRGNIEPLIKNLNKSLKKIYQNALDEVLRTLQKALTKGDLAQVVRLDNLFRVLLMNAGNNANKKIELALRDTYKGTYYVSAYGYEKAFGGAITFGKVSDISIRTALLNPLDAIGWKGRNKAWIEKATKDIRGILANGVATGKGYDEIAKKIAQRVNVSYRKAIKIANTETHRIMEVASNEVHREILLQGEELGIELKKIWIATLDDRTRESHREMDGQVADRDGMFVFPDGTKVEAPSTSGIPEEDINCRCTVVIDTDYPKVRRDNLSGEVVKFQNYKEWLKSKESE